jgi:hypothetical protein
VLAFGGELDHGPLAEVANFDSLGKTTALRELARPNENESVELYLKWTNTGPYTATAS